jgi:hypothetical protein
MSDNTQPHRNGLQDSDSFQAAIIAHYDRACRFAERSRRRYRLQDSDADVAVLHAFERLAKDIGDVKVIWPWLKETICNRLLTAQRHAQMVERRKDDIAYFSRARNEGNQQHDAPSAQIERFERAAELHRLADEFKARRRNPVSNAVVDAMLNGTYNAGALAREFKKKVSWISTLRGEFRDFLLQQFPRTLLD